MTSPVPVARVARLLVVVLLVGGQPLTAAPLIDGTWVVDEDRSDDVEDAFEDRLRRESFPIPYQESAPNQPQSPRDASQAAYWDTVRTGEERRSVKNLQRLGSVYPLVVAEKVAFEIRGAEVHVTYDEVMPRVLRPNPAGRVYSAKGDELISDSVGYTLTWWDGETLVAETDPPDGGKVVERFAPGTRPGEIEYTIKLTMRILEEPVEFTRVLVRPGADD